MLRRPEQRRSLRDVRRVLVTAEDMPALRVDQAVILPRSPSRPRLLRDVRVIGVLLVAGEALLLIGIVLLWLVATVLVLRWVA